MNKIQSINIRTHLLLQLLLASMSVMVFGSEEAVFRFSYQRVWWALVFYVSQNILCYANIYFLVPRYLYKHKFTKYILWCILFAIIAFATLCLVSQSLAGNPNADAPTWLVCINSISSIITMAVMIASSTTLVLFADYHKDKKRAQQLKEASVEAELSILKEQINPHFLFNTLNNVNVLLKRDAEEAAHILFKLEDLLRYQLKDCDRENVSLQSDIDFLNNYLRLEKIRRDNFEYHISVDGNATKVILPPLLFITFVENAVKHNAYGYSKTYVDIFFHISEDFLIFTCENSKAEETMTQHSSFSGLGLKNIRRRLELLYPDNHELDINDKKNVFCVRLKIKL